MGFAATEKAFAEICERLGTDASPLLEESERRRAACWFQLNDLDQMHYLSSGSTFAVEGMDSVALAYTAFLTEYLGLTPACVSLTGSPVPALREKLRALLRSCRAEDALERDILDSGAELVFADANVIAAMATRQDAFSGVEISLPGMGYVDFVKKTHLGLAGAEFLTEQAVNGLMSRI